MQAVRSFTIVFAAALLQHHCGLGTARLEAQTPASKAIAGTVTGFKPGSLEIGIQPDNGSAHYFKVGPDTEVVQVPPGATGLVKGKPVKVTDIARGDRILVSFVSGLAEARRIILISSADISARNEGVSQDWKTRGISGTVTATSGNEITLQLRSMQGPKTVTVEVNPQTRISRYAPDSVKFVDAVASTVAEIAPGDQLQARGERSADQARVTAEDVVFGTFLTKLGTITSINREAGEVRILESTTKQPLTIRITADSRLKKIPDMTAAPAPAAEAPHAAPAQPSHNGPPAAFDLQKTLEGLPSGTIDDLKVGGGIVVTSTRGSQPGQVTAIMILANAGFFVKASEQPNGLDAINKMHGGMLVGPTGFSLPTILQ